MDPTGLRIGDAFATPGGAAKDAMIQIGSTKVENGGIIFYDFNTKKFYASQPVQGDEGSVPYDQAGTGCHEHTRSIGVYHNHVFPHPKRAFQLMGYGSC
jgi:hypothetical protein